MNKHLKGHDSESPKGRRRRSPVDDEHAAPPDDGGHTGSFTRPEDVLSVNQTMEDTQSAGEDWQSVPKTPEHRDERHVNPPLQYFPEPKSKESSPTTARRAWFTSLLVLLVSLFLAYVLFGIWAS